jgi:predicted nucleic acid-binding protein
MNGKAAYLDSSAFLKLVVTEPESRTLQRFMQLWPQRASAALLRTEVIRALRRAGYESRVGAARRLIRSIRLISLDEPLLDQAGELDQRDLRTLDAVHLAAALAIGSELGVLLTYDTRLESAARERGIAVQSPGRDGHRA